MIRRWHGAPVAFPLRRSGYYLSMLVLFDIDETAIRSTLKPEVGAPAVPVEFRDQGRPKIEYAKAGAVVATDDLHRPQHIERRAGVRMPGV